MRYAHIETEESRRARADMMLKSEQFRDAHASARDALEQEILARPLGTVINLVEATPEFVATQPGMFIEMKEDTHPAEIGGTYDEKNGFRRAKGIEREQ